MAEAHAQHGHNDGIIEGDNPLPRWWLGILAATIVFGYGYWVYYHVGGLAPGQIGEYERAQAEEARRAAAQKPATDELLQALAADPQTVGEGAKVFAQSCASCHGDRAEGKIGPNLTDGYWLHGGKPMDLHAIVQDGFLDKGMPAWGGQLGPTRTRAVVAYVVSLRGTNVPGKEPQGQPE